MLTIGVLLAIAFEFAMKLVRAKMVDRASMAIDLELSSVFFGKASTSELSQGLELLARLLPKSDILSRSGTL